MYWFYILLQHTPSPICISRHVFVHVCVHFSLDSGGFRLLHVQLPFEVCCILMKVLFPEVFRVLLMHIEAKKIYMQGVFWVERKIYCIA